MRSPGLALLAAACSVAWCLVGPGVAALRMQGQGSSLHRLAEGLKKAAISGHADSLNHHVQAVPPSQKEADVLTARRSQGLLQKQAYAQEPEAEEEEVATADNDSNESNETNFTIPPPPTEHPPEIPRRPGPMQDDPYTNVTGCEPFPCEVEDHYRPPLDPPAPYPPPRCGYHGMREIRLAWNGNWNHTQNLTINLFTSVDVQVGWDPTYDEPRVKVVQPLGLLDVVNGLVEIHDCREVNAGWIGFFTLECVEVRTRDPYSEDEFMAEWGLGKLTVMNSTYNNETETWIPGGCIPDTYIPKLESMEMGIQPNDTQYITFGLGPDGDYFNTRKPTLWLKSRCETCTVPNPAYWDELYGPQEMTNVTNCTNETMPDPNDSNNSNCTLFREEEAPPDPDYHHPDEHGWWSNISEMPKVPPWSTRILLDPLPPGIPEGTQIVEPWDQITLRYDECVQPTNKMITFTPLNPPPRFSTDMKPRGYRMEAKSMQTRASDVYLVSVWCGNVTIRPPEPMETKNKGQMYEIDIPAGAFTDYGVDPNPSLPIKFNITVKDKIRPHVWPKWDEAFYPLQGHTGRYWWQNITIRFDESLMFNPRKPDSEIVITLDPRDDKYKTIEISLKDEEQVELLEEGEVLHINPFGHQKDEWTGDPLGLEIGATYYVTLKQGVFTDWFGNDFMGISTCDLNYYHFDWGKATVTDCYKQGDGTYPYEACYCAGGYHFQVVTQEQLDMRKNIGFLLKWIRLRLNDTLAMFHLPTFQDEFAVDGSALIKYFKDAEAGTQVTDLLFYMGHAQLALDDPDGLMVLHDLTDIYNNLHTEKVEPRGYSFREEWVCGELLSHVLPSSSFKCSYAAQKVGTGFDAGTQSDTFYFREGCFCRINWQGGCPYQLHHYPTYLDFGFRDMEEKIVTGKMKPMKFTENALCWYWSHPEEPWWGYLGHESHYFYGADLSQQFYCAYPRSPDQPCSTMRFWEWDIKQTKKKFWNKASAYHPKEIVK